MVACNPPYVYSLARGPGCGLDYTGSVSCGLARQRRLFRCRPRRRTTLPPADLADVTPVMITPTYKTVIRSAFVIFFSLLVPLISMSSQTYGQSWLKDDESCFCLLHHSTNQLLRNCTGVKFDQDSYVTATCIGSEAGDPKAIIKVRPPWMPIREGAPNCAPCRPGLRRTRELPRKPG